MRLFALAEAQPGEAMDWNAKLDWAEEVYTMLVVLPVPVIGVAVLWYLAPRLYRRRLAARNAAQLPAADVVTTVISGKTAAERT
jgi:hypothetical protein